MSKQITKRYFSFKSKKGVSPLIATVLLIAFAVALGAVVMNWGRSYVEDTAAFAREKSDTEVKCSMDVKISIGKIDKEPVICFNVTDVEDPNQNGTVEVLLENGPTTQIEGLQIRLIGNGTKEPGIIDLENTTIKKAYSKFLNITYDDDELEYIKQVKIIPQIESQGKLVYCPDSSLTIDDIQECE